ncbi:MAG: ferrochelatase [Gemmatimonadota bacterium]|nr:ferrochelatase [Gemmatimonadota bacterium]
MKTHDERRGVLLVNFGEPETPDPGAVEAFLERIFFANADLEAHGGVEGARARSAELARRRAPGLLADYEKIGGSPLHAQAATQARALATELASRGRPAAVECGMQFTEPSIGAALSMLRDSGVTSLTVLPVYPLCGPSTTVASLRRVEQTLYDLDWSPGVAEVSGWHRHPAYIALRAAAIADTAVEAGVRPGEDAVELVFSAHGTPIEYVRAGSRYVEYVEDVCARVARELGVERYTLGYQNHANRGIEWTAPSIDDAIADLAGSRSTVVVDAASFVHEQSETLVELDHDLREAAEGAGLTFIRVPIPHDDPRLIRVLADLVDASWKEGEALASGPCVCRPGAEVCLNAGAAG